MTDRHGEALEPGDAVCWYAYGPDRDPIPATVRSRETIGRHLVEIAAHGGAGVSENLELLGSLDYVDWETSAFDRVADTGRFWVPAWMLLRGE